MIWAVAVIALLGAVEGLHSTKPDARGDVSLARPRGGGLQWVTSTYVSAEALQQLLEREGREFMSAPRPAWVRQGLPQHCFKNATLLALRNNTLRYAEGIVYKNGRRDEGILHAWDVTADGIVIDPTLPDAEHHRYFGIVHEDPAVYLGYLLRHRVYGVLGGPDTALAEWLTRKGITPLQDDPQFAPAAYAAHLARKQKNELP